MSKQKTYYKVLKPDNASSYATGFNRIYYTTNVPITTENNRPIFIFNTLKNARSYATSNLAQSVIYKCTAKRVRKPYKIIVDHNCVIGEYWKTVVCAQQQKKNIIKALDKNRNLRFFTAEPITGTLWANSITLTKQIQSNE